MQKIELDQYLRYNQVAARLGVSVSGVKRWCAERHNNFPQPRYLGRVALFLEADVAHWVECNLAQVPPEPMRHRRGKAA